MPTKRKANFEVIMNKVFPNDKELFVNVDCKVCSTTFSKLKCMMKHDIYRSQLLCMACRYKKRVNKSWNSPKDPKMENAPEIKTT